MTVLHVQTLIDEARRALRETSTRYTGNTTRDLFCAQLVGYLRAYDITLADELALALEMPELTEKQLFKFYEERQA